MVRRYRATRPHLANRLDDYAQQARHVERHQQLNRSLRRGALTAIAPMLAAGGAAAQVECLSILPAGTQTLAVSGPGETDSLAIILDGSPAGGVSLRQLYASAAVVAVFGSPGWGPLKVRASASESTTITNGAGYVTICTYFTSAPPGGPFCAGTGPGFLALANSGNPGFIELEVTSMTVSSVSFRLLSYGFDLSAVAHAGDCSTVLPVELVSFGAVSDNGTPVLNWETASELNNAGFEVQRAAGDGAFEKVSFVTGHGTSDAAHSYSFRDESAVPNIAYRYRLKQLDLDGTTSFSSVVEVFTEVAGLAAISEVYPNPANGSDARVDVNLAEASTASIEVFDVRGALVRSEALALNRGENRVRLDVNGLAPGSHFAKINLGDQVVYRPFVVGR